MKGSKCRCGFATVADRNRCPRCGKQMKQAEWPDEGKVLSYMRLQVMPEGFDVPYDMALVGLKKGPKIVCWTAKQLEVDQEVIIAEQNGKYVCSAKPKLDFDLDKDALKT